MENSEKRKNPWLFLRQIRGLENKQNIRKIK